MKVVIQLDHLSSLNMQADSTLFIAFALQMNSHEIYTYHPESLTSHNGSVMADVSYISLDYRDDGYHYLALKEAVKLDLSDFDLVLIRQDPPFDMKYITTCHLLARLLGKCVVLNNPISIINQPEKLSVLNFPEYLPDTMVCSSLNQADTFIAKHKKVVVKPLYGYAGKDVILVDSAEDWKIAVGKLLAEYGYIVLQRFLPAVVVVGDKRVFMLGSEVVGAFQRKPAVGDIRANLAAGGTAFVTTLTPKEEEICGKLGPWLRDKGLFFAGVDLIDEHLIEINITSPTGLTTLKQLGQLDFKDVAGKIEEYLIK